MWGPILGGFTILGAFLTLSAWINGRTIKRYLGDLIKSEAESARKMIDEMSRRMDERTAKISELIRETRDLTRETRDLIVTEGGKTRELIKALK